MAKGVALVTGGGRRIGAEIVRSLIRADWYVLIHVRSSKDEALALLAGEPSHSAGQPAGEVLVADLSTDEGLANLIEAAKRVISEQNAQGLGVLVHNASIYTTKDYESVSLEELRQNIRIHLEVPFLLTQGLTAQLKTGSGCVIGMVDTSLGRAWDGLSHYTSTKAALRQLMMNLAGDLAPDVRVNCVAPGAVMAADWEAEHFASVIERVPLGRGGAPEDVAKAVLFLTESTYLSGQVINVDGGWSIAP
ncbi:MAG: SDR family NAD(P)-dependent oxidoreductase [Candidatus Poseidoniales archaeon]|nr:MAG: SDR family NAD(P)-dependent oxidoreductase [Candidatus Poseidoniales archaeon]